MESEHQIIGQILLAKSDSRAADELVKQYLPFIKSEVSKFTACNNNDYEDCLSIGMFAFHEAVVAYTKSKGAFLKFASVVIKNRLIDYKRRESRHASVISIDSENSEEDGRTILDRYDSGEDNVAEHHNYNAAKEEIKEFAESLSEFGLEITDIADNCPKQDRTLRACHKVLQYAKQNPQMLDILTATKKLPVAQLCQGSGVERKLIERHRKYIVAILLAYTNGFEIIRGHLKQIIPGKGGTK